MLHLASEPVQHPLRLDRRVSATMYHTIDLLLSALTDAAAERLSRAALLGRTHVDVEQDMLAATGLPISVVQRVVRIAAVRHVRACRCSADARAFVGAMYGCARVRNDAA